MADGQDKEGAVKGDAAPAWLDKGFIERILRRDADRDTLTVVAIKVKKAVPKGDNYASLLLRVDTEYREEEEKPLHRSLIVKSVPDGEMMRKWIDEMNIFSREAHIYQVTLPAIYRLVKDRTGSEPEHLATHVYQHDRPETIVLGDLKPLGYKMANRRQGLDLQHSSQALRTLARLHGFSVALHAQDPSSMDYYVEKMYAEASRKLQTDMMTSIFNSLAAEVKGWAGYERFEHRLLGLNTCCVDKVIDIVNNMPFKMRVLNHGDFWTNNMLFHYNDEGVVDDVKMVDFQMVRFNSPVLDIIYFLYTSPSQQVLEGNADELLRDYHTALCDTMRSVGCDQALFITFDQLQQEMEAKKFFSLFISSLFSIMVAEPEDAPDFTNLKEEDLEKGTFDSMNKVFAGKRFRDAFQRRLLNFEAEGLL